MFFSTKNLCLAAFGVLAVVASPITGGTTENIIPLVPKNLTIQHHHGLRTDLPADTNSTERPKYTVERIEADLWYLERAYNNAEQIVGPYFNSTLNDTALQTTGSSLFALYFEGERVKFDIKEHVQGIPDLTTQQQVDYLASDVHRLVTLSKKVLGWLNAIEKQLPALWTPIRNYDGKAKLMIQYRVMFFWLQRLGKHTIASNQFGEDQLKDLQAALHEGWVFFTMSTRSFKPS